MLKRLMIFRSFVPVQKLCRHILVFCAFLDARDALWTDLYLAIHKKHLQSPLSARPYHRFAYGEKSTDSADAQTLRHLHAHRLRLDGLTHIHFVEHEKKTFFS